MDMRNWKARQRHKYLDAIEKIQGRGVSVCGCFIVGLDADTPAVFDEIAGLHRANRACSKCRSPC